MRPTLYSQIAFDSMPGEVPIWTLVQGHLSPDFVQAVSIQRGRQRELDRDEAGRCTTILDGAGRRFDPNYAAGPYFGSLESMRRIRHGAYQALGALPYLELPGDSGSYAWTENTGGLGFTGDLDVRIKLALADWTFPIADGNQVLVARQDRNDPTVWDWIFYLDDSGTPGLAVSNDGGATLFFSGASFNITGIADGSTLWLRVTLDANNGAGGRTARFYKSTSPTGASWTQIGADITDTPAVTLSNLAPHVAIGCPADRGSFLLDPIHGGVLIVDIRDSIGGSVVSMPRFADLHQWWRGDRAGREELGRAWYLEGGAAIPSGMFYLFHGFNLGFRQTYPKKRNCVVPVQAVDAFHVLNLDKVTFSAVEQATADRVDETLDLVGWSPSERVLGTSQTTIIAEEIEETPALEHLQRIAEAEYGRIFISKAGAVVFRGRYDPFYAPLIEVLYTFGDSGEELRYKALEIVPGEQLVFNHFKVSRVGGGGYQEALDGTSIDHFYRRTKTRSNLPILTDAECLSAARYGVAQYKDERQRVEEMTIDPERDPELLWPAVLTLELGDRVLVRRRPLELGDPIEQESIVEGIEWSIEPAGWIVKFNLSPATNQDFGILDHVTKGLLDQTMRLVY